MTSEEFRQHQARLGVTNQQLADWLGINADDVMDLREGRVRASGPIVRALLLAEAAERVSRLNPESGEIGPGMLQRIISEAKQALPVAG